jgi:hypothetical protein
MQAFARPLQRPRSYARPLEYAFNDSSNGRCDAPHPRRDRSGEQPRPSRSAAMKPARARRPRGSDRQSRCRFQLQQSSDQARGPRPNTLRQETCIGVAAQLLGGSPRDPVCAADSAHVDPWNAEASQLGAADPTLSGAARPVADQSSQGPAVTPSGVRQQQQPTASRGCIRWTAVWRTIADRASLGWPHHWATGRGCGAAPPRAKEEESELPVAEGSRARAPTTMPRSQDLLQRLGIEAAPAHPTGPHNRADPVR